MNVDTVYLKPNKIEMTLWSYSCPECDDQSFTLDSHPCQIHCSECGADFNVEVAE